MNFGHSNIFWITLFIFLLPILSIYYKLHRKKPVLYALFFFVVLSAFVGFYLLHNAEEKFEKDVSISVFYSPIIYLSFYQFCRTIFKWKFNMEPTYDYSSSYDSVDKRDLLCWDYVVFILPIVLAFGLPYLVI